MPAAPAAIPNGIFPIVAQTTMNISGAILTEAGLSFLEAEVQMVPTTTVVLDEAGQEKPERLIDRLDELDDVMNVYHNWEE